MHLPMSSAVSLTRFPGTAQGIFGKFVKSFKKVPAARSARKIQCRRSIDDDEPAAASLIIFSVEWMQTTR